ncbi:DUF2750 domain-containing protein [Microbulbifer agarilyticus]|uniref:DUF2750 domain-containing protein n=1 Tax=Microbulbifer agarilyticus TaxID=260552 RepID=UPI001CD4D962|nr:DUF2750 domain-containing protein [Microbulbifer agarilyticus]MCA0901117.1 DUF2750 domain-containing protein [Microbulbifer agarilyticus]
MDDTPEEAQQRHLLFMQHLMERGVAWALHNGDGLANFETDEGELLLPLWSSCTAAESALGNFKNYEPIQISKEDLLDWVLPAAESHGMWIGTDLNPSLAGLDVPATYLKEIVSSDYSS